MSYTKHLNKNNQFMVGIFVMVFAVFCVIGIFLWMCYDKAEEFKQAKRGYQIELAEGFAGDSIQLYVNDSILFENRVSADTLVTISFKPFAEQHMISIGDVETGMAKNMNISGESGRIVLKRSDDKQNIRLQEIPFENE